MGKIGRYCLVFAESVVSSQSHLIQPKSSKSFPLKLSSSENERYKDDAP